MKRFIAYTCAAAWAFSLVGCGGGGGGGGGDSKADTYQLSFSPSTLTTTFGEGSPTPVTVTATLNRNPGQVINAVLIDTVGVLEPNVQLQAGAGYSYVATLMPKASLKQGEYAGSLQVKLCYDAATVCASPLPGSPYALPYKFVVTPPPAATVSPASVSLDIDQDEQQPVQLYATMTGAQGIPKIIDKDDLFQVDGSITTDGPSIRATLKLNPNATAGTHTGHIELHLCVDAGCSAELRGSPVRVPYTVALKATVNLSPLQPVPGAADWSQHQGNAAHTGYVPLTLDPAKFNRRWKWKPPMPATSGSQGPKLQTVVMANNTVYALVSGYYQETTLYALAEQDKSQRWNHPFGGVSQANPPAVDGDAVYLTAANRQGAMSLWAFRQGDGALKFSAPYAAQMNTYLAPTITNGQVFTGGGYYGGLLGYQSTDGTQSWYLDKYDIRGGWTPAADSRTVYSYFTEGLMLTDARTGATSVINHQVNSSDGSPVIAGPDNVIVTSGHPLSGVASRLVSFDTATKTIRWSVDGEFRPASPATAKGTIYVANGSRLEARSVAGGNLLWAWTPDESSEAPFGHNSGAEARNIIVTDNLLFVSTYAKVYAVSLSTHQPVWTFPFPGQLALSANGILYVRYQSPIGSDSLLYAINLR